GALRHWCVEYELRRAGAGRDANRPPISGRAFKRITGPDATRQEIGAVRSVDPVLKAATAGRRYPFARTPRAAVDNGERRVDIGAEGDVDCAGGINGPVGAGNNVGQLRKRVAGRAAAVVEPRVVDLPDADARR